VPIKTKVKKMKKKKEKKKMKEKNNKQSVRRSCTWRLSCGCLTASYACHFY
jgi:hypothetical protein